MCGPVANLPLSSIGLENGRSSQVIDFKALPLLAGYNFYSDSSVALVDTLFYLPDYSGRVMSSLPQHSSFRHRPGRAPGRSWTAWLATLELVDTASSRRPASTDASFRRYFRSRRAAGACSAKLGDTLIAMDAPPERENVPAFIHVDGLLFEAGVTVPAIVARDVERGYLLHFRPRHDHVPAAARQRQCIVHVFRCDRRADRVPADQPAGRAAGIRPRLRAARNEPVPGMVRRQSTWA